VEADYTHRIRPTACLDDLRGMSNDVVESVLENKRLSDCKLNALPVEMIRGGEKTELSK
jgi:hypothetical protein